MNGLRKALIPGLLVGLVVIFLIGCCSPTAMKSDYTAEYVQVLGQLDDRPGPSEAEAQKGIEGFKTFFGNFSENTVREMVPGLYAPDAYLNDTLKTVRGNGAIREYFLETAKNTELVKATIQDVSVSGHDYYVRWIMDVRFAKMRRGETIRTMGITHLRFDSEGRIVMHQDYWDPAAGVYEHIPVIGSAIRWIKSKF